MYLPEHQCSLTRPLVSDLVLYIAIQRKFDETGITATTVTLLGRLVGQLSTSDTMYIYYVAVEKILSADGTSMDPIINIIHDTPLNISKDKTVIFSVKCNGSLYSLLSIKTLTEHQHTSNSN